MKTIRWATSAIGTLCFFLLLLPSLAFAFRSAPPANHPATAVSLFAAKLNNEEAPIDPFPEVQAEVIGAGGRIGSLFLRSQPNAKPLPKGIAPGNWSPPDAPLFVCTPAAAWPQILELTDQSRRSDLVWVGNGLPPSNDGTVVVPHFGVLQVNGDPVTSSQSPPTFVYGKHAEAVEEILQTRGIPAVQIQTLDNYPSILVAAAQKLVWASTMWLLCHVEKEPITALQVHSQRQDLLERLVRDELVPALQERLKDLVGNKTKVNPDAVLDYMLRYSQSMPQAIPNLQLAQAEWKERNAFFLKATTIQQPLHQQLLNQVGGITPQDIQQAVGGDDNTTSKVSTVEIPSLGLTVYGNKPTTNTKTKSAIVIGAGILGSSVALHLARQGCASVTVVEAQSSSSRGQTTPASWAWLNANGKSPPPYAWLNQLGMRAWKTDPLFKSLPSWCGALCRYDPNHRPPELDTGGYLCEGPLTVDQLKALEPAADWGQDDSSVYFYPEEGFVDPMEAVHVMREEAAALGVQFCMEHNVTNLVRNEKDTITGITVETTGGKMTNRTADVVVLAAGMGSAPLGKIPFLQSPGQMAFAEPSSEFQLQRILVDTVRETHVLQRRCGSLVVGGGALEIGGDGAAALDSQGLSKSRKEDDEKSTSLLAAAKRLVPGGIGELVKVEKALRPIPLDGLPAVGYLAPGLYTVVSHSGVTLAPILGALAATELTKGLDIETLEAFRPKRFFPPT